MSKKTIIPVGYRVTVTSWENDADNYNTEMLEGLSENAVKFVIDLCKLCYSQNNWKGPKGFGNMYDPSEGEMEGFLEAIQGVIDSHPDHGMEYCDTPDGVMETIISELGLSGGEYYVRVLESVKIEYVPEEITLEEVTDKFM